ncbi:hypothetical protein OS493_028474 [Desmophyllum pertusum]|uniref:Uncharacterized protein n=1 Tax=Desmophyllum pertusum TaxID=174260 RepID=A0A9W9ZL11_9CNID|nr:hypothetical protein OS493_028474 [Desmophyllum pertusum]
MILTSSSLQFKRNPFYVTLSEECSSVQKHEIEHGSLYSRTVIFGRPLSPLADRIKCLRQAALKILL